jgi:hypothetical protein
LVALEWNLLVNPAIRLVSHAGNMSLYHCGMDLDKVQSFQNGDLSLLQAFIS